MRWLMITRKLDPADDRAGFVTRWVEELAARLDRLDVICQESANPPLPANVTVSSMGKESGAGRVAQAARFTGHLRRLVPGADGVFCHMIPRYVIFAAPWARLAGKPLFFWYTHRQVTPELRLAHRLATRILTAAPGSFPLPSPKVAVMGHGIEADLFPASAGESAPPEVLMIGRLSRIKRQDWLLRAASKALAGGVTGPFRVALIGGAVEHEPDVLPALRRLAESLDPAPDVAFTGALPHSRVAGRIGGCAAAVNLSPPGLFDKGALEPMLAGKPTIVTNPDFLPLLGEAGEWLLLPPDASDDELADRLARLLALSPDGRAAIGAGLRARALAAHSLGGLMDRLAALMREEAGHA
jgi:glycosyltransferase involved in cell wall biosynthesis